MDGTAVYPPSKMLHVVLEAVIKYDSNSGWGRRSLSNKEPHLNPDIQQEIIQVEDRGRIGKESIEICRIFIFTYNLVFESTWYTGYPQTPLLFEVIPRMYHIQMRSGMIIHVVQIAGTQMIASDIDVLSCGSDLEGTTRGVKLLYFIPLYQWELLRSLDLLVWVYGCWGKKTVLAPQGWFEEWHTGEKFLLPTPSKN